MKKLITHFKRKFILILLFNLFMFTHIFGQDMISKEPSDYPPGTTFSPGSISLPAARLHKNETYTIPLLVTAPFNIYTSNIVTGCSAINSNYTLTNTDNVIHFLVTEKCDPGVSNFLSFILHVEKSGNIPDQQQFIIPIIRDTAKIVLTLDISGSMNLPVQSGTGSRIDALKNAVYSFVPKLEEFRQEGDSIAMTYFSSTIFQPNTPISEGFIPVASFLTSQSTIDVYNDLNPRTPLQMTALGEGLLDAKKKLSKDNSPNLKRMVFLFTDGLQNYGNQVKLDGNSFTLSTDSLNNYSTNPKDSIRYFPVATWAAGDEPELLQNIANGSGGEVLFVTPETNLLNWFDMQLVNMLDDGSPQIVLEKSVKNITNGFSQSFQLNELVKTLLIEISTNDILKASILKDGVDISSKAHIIKRNNNLLLSFTFPLIREKQANSGGEWQIKLSGRTKGPVAISVIADDHYFDYECTVDKDLHTVGDTIFFKTKLSYLGNPLSASSNKVTAIVLKPGEDLGDLLSTYPTPEMDNLIDINSGASQKFNELYLNDSTFYNSLIPTEQVVNLTDKGNGEYTGYFEKTELAGIYNVMYLINGEIPDYGKFLRTKTLSTIFVFGQIVQETPEIVDNGSTPNGNNPNFTILRIKPKNKFGKLMGPGFQSKINVSVNKKPVRFLKTASTQIATHKSDLNLKKDPYLEKIADNLDGSYLLYIANVSPENASDISIKIRGENLYEVKAQSIPFWFYIIVIIILFILMLLKKNKSNPKIYKILMWILLLICVLIYVLQKLNILSIL